MIAKLTGLIDSMGEDWLILDVNGVGYLVNCSARTLGKLPEAGQNAALLIETVVREDAITLYGFASRGEKDWFKLLTTVQGVGAKVGLAILSVLETGQIAQAIAAQDKAAIGRANGVGPKLAQRIVTELREKAGAMSLGAAARLPEDDGGAPPGRAGGRKTGGVMASASESAVEEALSALVNLGYQRVEAFAAVSVAAQEMGDANSEGLIAAALKELGKS